MEHNEDNEETDDESSVTSSGASSDTSSDIDSSTSDSSSSVPSDSSASSLPLHVDENGDLIYGGAVNKATAAVPSTLRDATTTMLLDDIASLQRAKPVGRNKRYSAGATHWVGANSQPATALERLALDIFRHHTIDADYAADNSGAEWWPHRIDQSDDIGFHWDRDYALEDEGIFIHPVISTVTYCSTVGAPTIVAERPSPLSTSESCSGPVPSVTACYPQPGRHLSFDGKLLHGAPASLALSVPAAAASTDQSRVTFLVNIWLNYTPRVSVPLKGCEGLQGPETIYWDSTGTAGSAAKCQEPLGVVVVDAKAPRSAGQSLRSTSWSFGPESARLELRFPFVESEWLRDGDGAPKGDAAPLIRVDCDESAKVVEAGSQATRGETSAPEPEPTSQRKRPRDGNE